MMPTRTRRAVLLVAAAALSALSLAAAQVPRPAGPLVLRTNAGQQVELAKLKGKVVAVMFFSTDCPHCQKTADMLGPIYAEFHSKGFEILGLAVNPSAAANLGQFVANHKVKFPIGLATRAQWTEFCQLPVMGQNYVPHLVIVDKAGVIQEDHPGADRDFWLDQEAKLRGTLGRLLK